MNIKNALLWLECRHGDICANHSHAGAYAGFHFGRGWSIWRARVARAYNGGLGAEHPAGSRGRAPGGGRGLCPLKLKAFCCETSKGSRKMANFWEKSNHTFEFAGCQGLRLFGVSKMTVILTSLYRIWSVCTATTWCSEGDWSILHKTREDP